MYSCQQRPENILETPLPAKNCFKSKNQNCMNMVLGVLERTQSVQSS